jgi:hypothetical protein
MSFSQVLPTAEYPIVQGVIRVERAIVDDFIDNDDFLTQSG